MDGTKAHNQVALGLIFNKYKEQEMELVEKGAVKPYEKIVSGGRTDEFVVANGGILHKTTDKYGATYTGLITSETQSDDANAKAETYFVKDFCIPKEEGAVYNGAALNTETGEAEVYFTSDRPEIANGIENSFANAVKAFEQNGEATQDLETPLN